MNLVNNLIKYNDSIMAFVCWKIFYGPDFIYLFICFFIFSYFGEWGDGIISRDLTCCITSVSSFVVIFISHISQISLGHKQVGIDLLYKAPEGRTSRVENS